MRPTCPIVPHRSWPDDLGKDTAQRLHRQPASKGDTSPGDGPYRCLSCRSQHNNKQVDGACMRVCAGGLLATPSARQRLIHAKVSHDAFEREEVWRRMNVSLARPPAGQCLRRTRLSFLDVRHIFGGFDRKSDMGVFSHSQTYGSEGL
nr:hypothetical protein CFP56_78407 [Quercus suber]